MLEGVQSEDDVSIPFVDFKRILEQNKYLQETSLRLKEENERLVDENQRLLEELEVTSALMHMLEQRNTELVTIQAREDRNELLHHLALVEEEMESLKTQYELAVLALDHERANNVSKDAEIASLNRLLSDESKDVVISSLGRRIAELERQMQDRSSSSPICNILALSQICCKSLSLCIQNDVLMLHQNSQVRKVLFLLEQNRFRTVSEILVEQIFKETIDLLTSLHSRMVDNNASLANSLNAIINTLTVGTESENGVENGAGRETLRRLMNSVRDAFLIERSSLVEHLNHLRAEKEQMLEMFGRDIARLGQLRDEYSEQ